MIAMSQLHTDMLDRDRLKDIASREARLCLTLTMNCDHEGAEAEKKNRIRFRNLVSKADELLDKSGWSWFERRRFLKPLMRMRKDGNIWRYQGKGLLVLCDDTGFFQTYRLPFPVEKNVIADRRFYLRPVIPYFQENVSFAVVILNQREAKIVFGDLLRGENRIAEPSGPLASFDEYMLHYEFEKSLQFVSRSARSSLFFGHGTGGDKATENAHLLDYYRHLENWVVTELRKANPDRIYYAADERNEGNYLKVVKAHHPEMERLAHINTAAADISALVSTAIDRIQKERDEKRLETIGEFQKRMQRDDRNISTGMREVILAAHDRRVEKLILPASTHEKAWGHIHEARHDIALRTADESTGEIGDELVNLAVIETFLNGGEIVPLQDADHLKTGVIPQYAALCRW